MLKLTKTLDDPSGIVSKLIFEDEETIAEAVAYRYKNRGVICISVQSGCPVGCSFCGTGRKYVRDLLFSELMLQVQEGLEVIGKRDKTQIMTMSMGEPMLNWDEIEAAAGWVLANNAHHFYISTVGIDDAEVLGRLLFMGKTFQNFGLQFSLHHYNEIERQKLLGNYPNLLPLVTMESFARFWTLYTGKKCYFNYICRGNETPTDAYEVAAIVDGMHLTCSVLCNTEGMIKTDPSAAIRFAEMVRGQIDCNVEVSVFDPAGQDTIGGGCGQLLYVQEKLKSRK